MFSRRTMFFVFLLILFLSVTARADWTLDGVPLCAGPGSQAAPLAVSDGNGGAIVVWQDQRTGINDLYAQRVDAAGNALWTLGGVPICIAGPPETHPCITSDGAGGAIIAWEDVRNTYPDIFAQRVNASGVVQWAANGVAVCAVALNQFDPAIVSDGAGGAIVTWVDYRSATNADVYVQRINGAGVKQWTEGGVVVAATAVTQYEAVITADGANGAIIAWSDFTNGDFDIFVRRVDASGTALWAANGVPFGVAPNNQTLPTIASDGAGGAIVAWQDTRIGNVDIYARRILSTGIPFWGDEGGTPVTTALGSQLAPVIVGDIVNHGAFVAWRDLRNGSGNSDIYVNRMNQVGGRPWSADGVPVCTAPDDQLAPAIVHDGDLGVIVAWYDNRSGERDIYAQRVHSGAVQWAPNGIPVCTAENNQFSPSIVSDGEWGAIVAWDDGRDGSPDIYAQRIYATGSIPTPVRDTPSLSSLSLGANYPNPFSTTTAFDLELASAARVTVDVFDVAGRTVRRIDVGHVSAGSRRLSFDGLDGVGRPLASGVYFYRVSGDAVTTTRKMIIVR